MNAKDLHALITAAKYGNGRAWLDRVNVSINTSVVWDDAIEVAEAALAKIQINIEGNAS